MADTSAMNAAPFTDEPLRPLLAPAGSTASSNASWFTPEEAELLRRELVVAAVRQRVFAGSGWLDALAADLAEVRRRTALSDGAAA